MSSSVSKAERDTEGHTAGHSKDIRAQHDGVRDTQVMWPGRSLGIIWEDEHSRWNPAFKG